MALRDQKRGFLLGSGDHIQRLDADDLLSPDKSSRLLEALNKSRGNQTFFLQAGRRSRSAPIRQISSLRPRVAI